MVDNSYVVYFHVKKLSGKAVVGIVVELDGLIFNQEHVVISIKGKPSANTLALMGWIEALKFCIESEYEDVIFVNQNKLIFDWFTDGNFNKTNQQYYEKIVNLMEEATKYGGTIQFEVRKGKHNKAKKYTEKKADELGIPIAMGNLMQSLSKNKQALGK